jgi:peptidoglycan/xylan/chitin deacetylase (PgdA/CDA1 family)
MWERSLEPLKPREVSRGPRGQRQIALTFDAGYEATDLSLLLGLLDREQVKATFFVTGKWVLRYPEQARWLATRNEVVGNHSWAHPEYTHLSDDAIREDLLTADRLLFKHFGHSVKPLFRLPFGDRDDRVLRILAENGYVSIYWSLDTLDSMEPRKSASFIIDRVTNRSDEELDGAIVLSHVGYPETCAAMPAIIGNLRARGFHFVTLLDWLQFNKAVKVP